MTLRAEVAAVVLAGGTSTRMMGSDKLHLPLGGRTVLETVIAGFDDKVKVIVVGPEVASLADNGHVIFTREHPVGGGPAAAAAAGVQHVTADLVYLIGGDMPFASRLLPLLLAHAHAMGDCDALLFIDEAGFVQPLGGLYRTERLREVFNSMNAIEGASLRQVVKNLAVATVALASEEAAAMQDVDTPRDLEIANQLMNRFEEEGPHMLDDWTAALAAELGLDVTVDVPLILDLAKDAAHAVARPAAPITTFLVGYAAAKAGGSAEDVTAASDTARLLAARWGSAAE